MCENLGGGGTREAFSSEIVAVELRSGSHSGTDLAMRHSEEHAQQRQGTEEERGPGKKQCFLGGRGLTETWNPQVPDYRMERQCYPVS